MKIKMQLLALAACAMLTACTSSKNATDVTGEWDVISLNGTSITPEHDVTPFLGFDTAHNHVYGFTGCNRLTGELNAKAFAKGEADFSRLGCTRMLCQDDRYERAFLDALDKVTRSKFENNELQLIDAQGVTVIKLRKR